jgi:hypothetical protein
MLRHCIVTHMSDRRVHEIVCRCWPQLHAGQFVTAGSLTQLDRRRRAHRGTPAGHWPEPDEVDDAPGAQGEAHRTVPFADRRAFRARNTGIDEPGDGPFDDAAQEKFESQAIGFCISRAISPTSTTTVTTRIPQNRRGDNAGAFAGRSPRSGPGETSRADTPKTRGASSARS